MSHGNLLVLREVDSLTLPPFTQERSIGESVRSTGSSSGKGSCSSHGGEILPIRHHRTPVLGPDSCGWDRGSSSGYDPGVTLKSLCR